MSSADTDIQYADICSPTALSTAGVSAVFYDGLVYLWNVY